MKMIIFFFFFFFLAEDGIRDGTVTGVQTCALPIWALPGKKNEDTLHWHRFSPTWICARIVLPRSDIGSPNTTWTPDTTPPSPVPWTKYSSAPRALMPKWVSTVYPR